MLFFFSLTLRELVLRGDRIGCLRLGHERVLVQNLICRLLVDHIEVVKFICAGILSQEDVIIVLLSSLVFQSQAVLIREQILLPMLVDFLVFVEVFPHCEVLDVDRLRDY